MRTRSHSLIMTVIFKLLVCVFILKVSESARILAVYPTPAYSHQVAFMPLTLELVKQGHEVVVLTTDPIYPKGDGPANLTEIDVHDISYNIWREKHVGKMEVGNRRNDVSPIVDSHAILLNCFENQIKTKEFQNILTQKFDIVLVETLIRSAIGLSHIFKAPLIQISSFGTLVGMYEVIGAPIHPFLYPAISRQRLYNITNWEKLIEMYNYIRMEITYRQHEALEDEMLQRNFGPDIPPLSELKNNVDMLFLNINPIWEGNRPVPPGVIYMGGLSEKPMADLPQDLQNYLDNSKHGVVYISFGTSLNPDLLPKDKVRLMAKVFSELKYDVLWKWTDAELPIKSKNVQTRKWFPQPALLKHPKIKVFITQAGLQSTDDAINAGIPVIGIPMLYDQWFNAEKYAHFNIGKILHFADLTEEEFKNAIETVAGDESYRKNIEKLRSLMRDQPQQPLDRAVWWIEYCIRNGGAKHLRAPAANMSWAQYLELEFVLFVAALFLTPLVILVVLFVSIVKYCVRSNNKWKSD